MPNSSSDPRFLFADRLGDSTEGSQNDFVLNSEQVESWRSAGYLLLDGLFPDDLIATLATDAEAAYPKPATAAARSITDFGSEGDFVFPSGSAAFNTVTLHPRLLGAIAQLLDTKVSDLRLTQSDLWPKYGAPTRAPEPHNNQDQRIHVDYPNHTLVHPPPWHRPEAVEAILYLSDGDHCGGATAIVPREGDDDPCYPWPIVATPGVGELHYVNDRASAEDYMREAQPSSTPLRDALYERERYVRFKPGTLLLYRHDVWHRGTPLKPDTMRLAQNLTFRRAECEWLSTLHIGWAWQLYRSDQAFTKLLAQASLDQRAVLGFPQPGSGYWCEQTIAAVQARFGALGMDMSPYLEAL